MYRSLKPNCKAYIYAEMYVSFYEKFEEKLLGIGDKFSRMFYGN